MGRPPRFIDHQIVGQIGAHNAISHIGYGQQHHLRIVPRQRCVLGQHAAHATLSLKIQPANREHGGYGALSDARSRSVRHTKA